MNQGKEIASDATGLRRHDPLGGGGPDGGVDRIAAGKQDPTGRFRG